MKILVTGAKGFVGKNLVSNLYNIKEGKNRTRQLQIEDIFEYDMDSTLEELDTYCEHADFVFNLAGVNRPNRVLQRASTGTIQNGSFSLLFLVMV